MAIMHERRIVGIPRGPLLRPMIYRVIYSNRVTISITYTLLHGSIIRYSLPITGIKRVRMARGR